MLGVENGFLGAVVDGLGEPFCLCRFTMLGYGRLLFWATITHRRAALDITEVMLYPIHLIPTLVLNTPIPERL